MRDDEYGRMYEAEDRFWWYVGLRNLVVSDLRRHLTSGSSNLILDAGCGTGGMLVRMKDLGTGVGIDLSGRALSLAARRGNLVLVRGSLSPLPFRSDIADAVVATDVLYHLWVSDDQATVKEFLRVLKPGGILVLHVAAFEFLRGPHDRVVFTRKRYRRREVLEILRGAGFQILRLSYRNSLLFPFVALTRLVRKQREDTSDVRMPSGAMNTILVTILRMENALLRLIRFPFGSSVYALARKPAPTRLETS